MKHLKDPQKPFAGMLLVSDMDGTLLNSQQRIGQKDRDAIYAFTRGGGLFTVATGRNQHLVKEHLRDLPIKLPCILLNGALLYDLQKEETVLKQPLDSGFAGVLQAVCEQFPLSGVEITTESGIYITRENAYTRAHQKRDGFIDRMAYGKGIDGAWLKVAFAWEEEKLKSVYEWLKPYRSEYAMSYAESTFLDISAPAVDKGACLKKLMEMFSIRRENVVAVGDYDNDTGLLRAAGRGIAVENACEALKAVADEICAGRDHSPIWDIVSRILTLRVMA